MKYDSNLCSYFVGLDMSGDKVDSTGFKVDITTAQNFTSQESLHPIKCVPLLDARKSGFLGRVLWTPFQKFDRRAWDRLCLFSSKPEV